jgi:diguanylate cyclase (GGDEF)-like protein
MDIPSRSCRRRIVKAVSGWPLWQLPLLSRSFVIAVPAAAAAALTVSVISLSFQGRQLFSFAVLLCCGLGSVEATRRIEYSQGNIVRDLLIVWCLPVAILLPPFYALVVPGPLLALTQIRVHRGLVYRRVFSAAAIALAYAAASWTFHSLPVSASGPSPADGGHAVLWGLAVAGCDALAWSINNTLIAAAIKASDREVKIKDLFSREALGGDVVQWTVAVMVTLTTAISPLLLAFAWPIVLLQRRYMMHAQLVSRTRVDPKTGLLNAPAWEREAAAAIARADRDRAPLAVAFIDIDHFKTVNDTHGHLVGDKVLHAICARFTDSLRPGDLAGRFGGEEFALLLPGASAEAAYQIAERLRGSIAQSPVTVNATGAMEGVSVTVSIGVATLDGTCRTVTELQAAADSALYHAKQAGRNCTYIVTGTEPPYRLASDQPGAGGTRSETAGR